MADLFDGESDDQPFDKRLRLSIRWLSVEERSMFPGKPYAQFQLGFFFGDVPLLNDSLYRSDRSAYDFTLAAGYFYGEDDDCLLLRGIDDLLVSGERLDFEDHAEPLFRLIISEDAFDPSLEADGETILFDVVAIIHSGANCHGSALGSTGPAIKLAVTPPVLRRFFVDLLNEALDPAVSDEASQSMLRQRYAEHVK